MSKLIWIGFARQAVLLCFGTNVDSFLHLPIWTVKLVKNKPKGFCLSLFSKRHTPMVGWARVASYNMCDHQRLNKSAYPHNPTNAFAVRIQSKHSKQLYWSPLTGCSQFCKCRTDHALTCNHWSNNQNSAFCEVNCRPAIQNNELKEFGFLWRGKLFSFGIFLFSNLGIVLYWG